MPKTTLAILHQFPCQRMVDDHPDWFHPQVREFYPQPALSLTRTTTVSSLTWLCLLPFSANVGRMALLFTGPGILCALATVFVSMAYVRNRHLFERIMQDKVSVVHFDFVPSC